MFLHQTQEVQRTAPEKDNMICFRHDSHLRDSMLSMRIIRTFKARPRNLVLAHSKLLKNLALIIRTIWGGRTIHSESNLAKRKNLYVKKTRPTPSSYNKRNRVSKNLQGNHWSTLRAYKLRIKTSILPARSPRKKRILISLFREISPVSKVRMIWWVLIHCIRHTKRSVKRSQASKGRTNHGLMSCP